MPRWAGLVTTVVLILIVVGGLFVMLARQSEGRREPGRVVDRPRGAVVAGGGPGGVGGLTVLLGGFLPVKRIPVERIASALAGYIEPAKWGGRGYRLVPDASAVVIRAGDGIIVTLNSGRRCAVTVDDAVTGAGLLNGLIGRLRSA